MKPSLSKVLFSRRMIAVLAMLTVAILAGGWWYYRSEVRRLRRDAEEDLATVAKSKVDQIVAWQKERLCNAEAVVGDPFLVAGVAEWLKTRSDRVARPILGRLKSLDDSYHYDDVMLVGTDGLKLLSVTETSSPLAKEEKRCLRLALQERKPVLTDLYHHVEDEVLHQTVVSPLYVDREGRRPPVAALLLVIDVRTFLYPLIQSWPTPSRSAETLLVEREGDHMLFLNDLRHKKGTALKLTIPLTRTNVPAVAAALGKRGLFYGLDYRGVKSVSFISPVGDTPWFMVSKMDRSEVFADLHSRSVLTLAFIGVLLVTMMALGLGVWQRAQRFQSAYEAEAELRRAQRETEFVLDAAGEGIYGVNLEGKVTFINPEAAHLLGFEREELLGQSLHAVNHPTRPDGTPYPREECPICAAFTDGDARSVNDDVFWRKDRTSFPVEYTSTPVLADDGSLTGAVVVFRDVTERKRAGEALRDANRQLEEALAELKDTQSHMIQQERLRALGQMASGIAHDFNNALAPVVGFSDLLLSRPEQLSDIEKVKHYLEVIATGAKDAASVVSRLREFYRKREEGEVHLPVDLNAVVKQAATLTQPKWKDQSLAAGINIAVHTDLGKVPVISGNEAELREALTNLIFNAVDAMPEGGTITIRTRVDEEVNGCRGDRVTLAAQSVTAPPGHLVTLSVSDTGLGMDEETRQRCLDPFYTTKGTGGTGMGLSMVFGIMLRHSGTMDIDSEVGRGTTITLRFPTYEYPELDGSQKAVGKPVGPLRVLLADDEPGIRSFVVDALTSDGCTVTAAENGRVALQRFQEGEFDLVITDRSMPEMNGDQLAAAIKEISPQTPVILATGFGDIMLAQGEKPAGVDLVIKKPATLITLREAIARVLAQP